MRWTVLLGVGCALVGLAVACASPGSQRIVGPDGSAMSHVHCGADQGTCFRIAGELCPNGYDINPVLSGSDGNFLVRCHDAPVAPVLAAASSVAPPGSLASAPPAPVPPSRSGERWPPANEPWPSAYPWPPPETSAAAQPPAASAPNAPGTKTEINLGF